MSLDASSLGISRARTDDDDGSLFLGRVTDRRRIDARATTDAMRPDARESRSRRLSAPTTRVDDESRSTCAGAMFRWIPKN
jgi:hypothetical protein